MSEFACSATNGSDKIQREQDPCYTPPGVEIIADPFALFADGTVKWEDPAASRAPMRFPDFFLPFRARSGFEWLVCDLCDSKGFSPSASRKARKDASRSRSGTAQGKRRRIMHTYQFNFKVSTRFTAVE